VTWHRVKDGERDDYADADMVAGMKCDQLERISIIAVDAIQPQNLARLVDTTKYIRR
jgi:hypothetical protein